MDQGRFEAIEATVDTGATYTMVPRSLLERLNITPTFSHPFILADGRRIERPMAEAPVRVNGQVQTTLVIFGDEGTEPLLGAYTLEGFALSVDPINRKLVPTPGMLLKVTQPSFNMLD